MNLEPNSFFNFLNSCPDDPEGHVEANRLLLSLNNILTEEQLNSSLIDNFIIHMFDDLLGLVTFLKHVLKKKEYKSSVLEALKILYTLVNNVPAKVEKYIVQINTICESVVKSNITTADEKVQALTLLTLGFQKLDRCMEHKEHYLELFKSLHNTSSYKKCDSVSGKLAETLGAFARKFPYLLDNLPDLEIQFLRMLERHMNERDPSYTAISGLFTALSHCYDVKPPDPDSSTDSGKIEKLFKYIEKLAPVPTSRIKKGNIAALVFFKNHIGIFKKHLLKKSKGLHQVLLDWLDIDGEYCKVGYSVIITFYKEVSSRLETRASDGFKTVTNYFIGNFKEVLKDNTVSNYRKRCAIHGIKLFAKACYIQLPKEDVADLVFTLLQNFEHTYILNEDPTSENWEYLPDHLQLVANFIRFKHITSSDLLCLQRAVVNLIKSFPHVPYAHQHMVIESILVTLFYLKEGSEENFGMFVEKVMYQGVIWTCTHQHLSEAALLEESSQKIITIKNYLPLWFGLLKFRSDMSYEKHGIFKEDRNYIYAKMIDKLTKTLLVLINKLNVSIHLKDEDLPLTNPEAIYEVDKVDDFVIFLNVVDLYQEIFLKVDPHMFEKCICKLITIFIEKCMEFPLISGFYKLLSSGLIISTKVSCFDEFNMETTQDIINCYDSVIHFLEILLTKMVSYKDELLISCLEVLLECPPVLVKELLELCVPAFVTVFTVGRTHLKLASMGVTTLERWQMYFSSNDMDSFLIQVLPYLDSFLRSKSFKGASSSEMIKKRRKTARALEKRKIVTELESELVDLQRQILNFIGQQSSTVCQAFSLTDNYLDQAFGTDKRYLKITLPYEDVKVDIFLDAFIPRILELALYCSDNKTRANACELLHAVITLFLGTSKSLITSDRKDSEDILRKMALPILQLGCDTDSVVRQLFEPLCLEIIHWYSHPSQLRGRHTAVMIDALMDGVTHPTNSSLRDFCGRCINEFIQWTIKQTEERQLIRDPINIKILVQKMNFFSTHPDNSKKLGASIIFNHIYRELREEKDLLSMFWVEILYIFMTCLSLMDQETSETEETILQINHSLNHLKRGFTEKSDLFNKYDEERRGPKEIGRELLLKDVLAWLLKLTGSRSASCREKAMSLYRAIAPHVKECQNDIKGFIFQITKDPVDWINDTYETGISKYPTLPDIQEFDSSQVLYHWVQDFLTGLDGYMFLMIENVMPENVLNESSPTLKALRYYLKEMRLKELNETLQLISHESWSYPSTEKNLYRKLKCNVTMKIICFANTVINITASYNCDLIWNKDMWEFILNCIFTPHLLGFRKLSPYQDHYNSVNHLLQNLCSKLQNTYKFELLRIIENYIASNIDFNQELNRNFSIKERKFFKGLIFLQSTGLVKEINFEAYMSGLIEKLMKMFLSEGENIVFIPELKDNMFEFCSLILQYAMFSDEEFGVLVNYIYADHSIHCLETYKDMRFGNYLLKKFEEPLMKTIINKFDLFINKIFDLEYPVDYTIGYLLLLLKYISANQKHFKHLVSHISKSILSKWSDMEEHLNEDIQRISTGIELIKLLSSLSPTDAKHKDPSLWLCGLLEKALPQVNSEVALIDYKLEMIEALVLCFDNSEESRAAASNSLQYFKRTLETSEKTNSTHMTKLISVVPTVKDSALFYKIIETYIACTKTDMDSIVEDCMKKYIIMVELEAQYESLRLMYDFVQISSFLYEQKYVITKRIIVPLFQNVNTTAFEQFFVENTGRILENFNEGTCDSNLNLKILHCVLIEILFLRLPIGSSERQNCPITEKCLNTGDSVRLMQMFLKLFLNVLKEEPSDSIHLNDLFRSYKCHSYNALCSLMCNSLKKDTFFPKLFIRQENGSDVLWQGLINRRIEMKFETDFVSLPTQRKVLINVRNELKNQRKLLFNNDKSMKYIESQRLFNSSLSEDITRYDFTSAAMQLSGEKSSQHYTDTSLNAIYLDGTKVNDHECMATVCGVISFLVSSGITDLPDEDEEIDLPPWMSAIRTVLMDENTHKNVKIFLVKVIDNTSTIFVHYAKWFLEPLLKFINDKCAGNDLNYFVTETIALIASWSTKSQPESDSEKRLASKLLEYLIEKTDNSRTDKFKYHLELVKLVVEAWKTYIDVPYDLLFAKISPGDKRVQIGIHVSAILLANNVSPWNEGNKESFLNVLKNIMQSNDRTIFKPCAETIGMSLKLLYQNGDQVGFLNSIQSLLKSLTSGADIDKYAYSLEGIMLHFPEIADDIFHFSKLLGRINSSSNSLKLIFLKIIQKRIDILAEISDFKIIDWDKHIECDNLDVQINTLYLISQTIEILEGIDRFKIIIQSAMKNVFNPNYHCRGLMYDIAIAVCKISFAEKKRFVDVRDICKDVIIQGLIDADMENKTKIYQFLLETDSFPVCLSERFSYILSELYKPSTEDNFLGYGTYLLISPIKNHPDYTATLFESPLEDCDFEEYNIYLNWRKQHPSSIPMFAETLKTYSEDLEMSKSNWNELRKTQTAFTFVPTMSARTNEFKQFTKSESSLLVQPEMGEDGETFINPNNILLSQKYRIKKVRFYKDKSKVSRHFAQEEVKKSVKREAKRYDLAREREKKVTIFRKYRKGDLPDIEITLASIVDPLQALCQNDSEVSKTFFEMLFKQMTLSFKEPDEFLKDVTNGIVNIFENSVQFNTNVFRTFLNILINNKTKMFIEPDLISNVCQTSGLLSTGTLLLEEYLISFDEIQACTKKSKGFSNSKEANYWVKLSELYRQMDEWDIVRAIFLQKMTNDETIQNAITAESLKHWRDAQELYRDLIEIDVSLERRDFYYESYFKCFACLGEWDKLPRIIEDFVSDSDSQAWDNLWDQGWNQQKLLPWYVSSYVKNMIFTQSLPDSYVANINRCLLDSEKGDYLRYNFAEELCMMWIFKRDTNKAIINLRSQIDAFLDTWQVVDPMFSTLRTNKILKLRNLIDINRFISVYDKLDPFDCESDVQKLKNYWRFSLNESLPSILLKETRVLYRKQFINLLIDKISSFNMEEELELVIKELKDMVFELNYSMIKSSLDQENYYMARKYYKGCTDFNSPKMLVVLSQIVLLKSEMYANSNDKIKILKEASSTLSDVINKLPNRVCDILLTAYLKQFEVLEKLYKIFTSDKMLFENYKTQLPSFIKDNKLKFDDIDEVKLYSVSKLKMAMSKYEEHFEADDMSSDKECELIAVAYNKLAYFLHSIGDHSADFIMFVLRAMKLGSAEGRQLFPCILMENSLGTEHKKLFMDETERIATWMFLGWLPQLLITIDNTNVLATSKIISRIARTYPQAIMYSYRLSKENYKLQNSDSVPTATELIKKLDGLLLSNPLVDKFLKALSNVSLPAHILKYYVAKMKTAADVGSKDDVRKFQKIILDHAYSELPHQHEGMVGSKFRDIQPFKRDFEKINYEKLKELSAKLIPIMQKLGKMLDKSRDKTVQLSQFCPWLSKFSASKIGFEFEIPGQYDGQKMPLVQHHIKISGFAPSVSIQESIRKPIKLTILGNDTKEYGFLIKFGEDIRQDQRIEQIFSLMNSFFQNDPACSQNHLSIVTYQVIPLTTSLGMIQWVDNTIKFQTFVRNNSPKKVNFDSIRDKYGDWITKKDQQAVHGYGKAAEKYDRNQVQAKFCEVVNEVPWDVLRIAFWNLSVNTESFIALKDNFVKSYAVICLCHWILGVGDRHLGNTLICRKSGKALGIDFGYAFGVATQILAIPELVPFRLTPHIVNLMEPLKEHGRLRECMIHCLNSLCNNSHSLLATMNVFIEEPSLDWLVFASRIEGSLYPSNLEWYPKQKIDQAKRKLQGYNPKVFTIEDLETGFENRADNIKKYGKSYIKLIEGNPEYNLRARKGINNLSVQEQVDCLIDQATDYNLLGRMYHGWEPWI